MGFLSNKLLKLLKQGCEQLKYNHELEQRLRFESNNLPKVDQKSLTLT